MTAPSTTRAVRLHRVRTEAHPEDVRVDDVAVPVPGHGEVLVRVRACGVCATDVHVASGTVPHGPTLPQVLGHEAAGEVAATGDGVVGWLPGDRVALQMIRSCGTCGYCRAGRESLCRHATVPGVDRDGVQSGYAVAEERHLVPVPGSVPLEQAAILTDAVATPYHALKRGGVGDGVVVAVFGLGGLGMHAVQLAKLAGSTVIGVDRDPVNLDRARHAGADDVVDASDGHPARAVRRIAGGGVDRSFEFVGDPAVVDQAVKCLAPGGRATVVGLADRSLTLLSQSLLVSQELEVVGSYGSTGADLNELVDLVDAGRLDLTGSITHRLAIDEVPGALRDLESRADHPVRMVATDDD